jgi:hypothetical protein
MRGNRWNNRKTLRRITRRRAEHDQGQYLQVQHSHNGKRILCLAHRLVWRHFKGRVQGQAQINHRNGVKKDNRPENLELMTASENVKHAYRTGLKDQHGQKNPAAKLTDGQVEAIRSIYFAGLTTQADLAAEFGVSFRTVSKIVRGERRAKQAGPTQDYTHRRQHGKVSRCPASGRFRGA